MWWPGIDTDLENMVKECDHCQQIRHTPAKAPLHPLDFPSRLWEQLHADFDRTFMGQMFLVIVDAYTK